MRSSASEGLAVPTHPCLRNPQSSPAGVVLPFAHDEAQRNLGTHHRKAKVPLGTTGSSAKTGRFSYQSNFSANCTCLAVVDVLVIAPAVPDTPEGVNTIRFGVLKFARFSRLKISALNCKFRRS
jgi:hypothetical protein